MTETWFSVQFCSKRQESQINMFEEVQWRFLFKNPLWLYFFFSVIKHWFFIKTEGEEKEDVILTEVFHTFTTDETF